MMKEFLGRTAYDAYSRAASGKSLVSGDRLPSWPELPDPVRDAWIAAALAAIEAVK